jgi:hypothetical protein
MLATGENEFEAEATPRPGEDIFCPENEIARVENAVTISNMSKRYASIVRNRYA